MLSTKWNPFILTGGARSGSTLLEYSIKQHPSIKIYHELLHPISRERGVIDSRRYEDGENGDIFLSHLYSDRYPNNIRAVGFKFFHDHARHDAQASQAWDFIARNKDIRIILISRNWFDMLVSRESAMRSKVWWIPRESKTIPPVIPRFEISLDSCHRYFQNQEKWRNELLNITQDHELLNISYLELCNAYQQTMTKVFDFLGTDGFESSIPTIKQRRMPAQKQVLNYEAIHSHFSSSRFKRFFD